MTTKIPAELSSTPGISDSSNATAITIDSNEKIIIGDTASHVDDLLQIETPASGGGTGIQMRRNDSNSDQGIGRVMFGNNTDTDLATVSAKTDGANDSGALLFATQAAGGASTEKMRIDSSGRVAIGTTSPDGVSSLTVKSQNTTSGQEFVSLHHQATSGLVYFISFMTESSGVDRGYITYNNSTNTVGFTQASDEILKENIRDLTGGLDFINQIKPRVFDWKEEGRGKDQVGFIAQEIETIKPEWVGEKEGHKNIPVDLTGTVPYLIKAIQEQQDIIEDLKSRIETLEG